MRAWKTAFIFPVTVNETAARLVAGAVACLGLGVLVSQAHGALPLLALGFLLRVIAGPSLSPLAIVVVRGVIPALRLPAKPVPGAPKRFAQGIGLAVTSLASVLALAGISTAAANGLVAALVLFATLEAAAGFCAGCWLFGRLARAGVFRAPVCVECAAPGSAARERVRQGA